MMELAVYVLPSWESKDIYLLCMKLCCIVFWNLIKLVPLAQQCLWLCCVGVHVCVHAMYTESE